MGRLLTLLLLYRSGYIVGKYISIEMIIEKTKETYNEVLLDSSINWDQGDNTYIPFVKYYLEVISSRRVLVKILPIFAILKREIN